MTTATVVAFDYQRWSLRFPEMVQYVDQTAAQAFFNEAAMYVDNTANSPVTDASVGGQREIFLWLVTAHIIKLNRDTGSGQPELVGRVASASQGSVSVQTDNQYAPGTAQWWQQTTYGASFWAMSAQYRRFRYHGKRGMRQQDMYSPFGPFFR